MAVRRVAAPETDVRLALIFACCHPDLPPTTRLILILRAACGLSTGHNTEHRPRAGYRRVEQGGSGLGWGHQVPYWTVRATDWRSCRKLSYL